MTKVALKTVFNWDCSSNRVRVCDGGSAGTELQEQLRAHISDSKQEAEYVPCEPG